MSVNSSFAVGLIMNVFGSSLRLRSESSNAELWHIPGGYLLTKSILLRGECGQARIRKVLELEITR